MEDSMTDERKSTLLKVEKMIKEVQKNEKHKEMLNGSKEDKLAVLEIYDLNRDELQAVSDAINEIFDDIDAVSVWVPTEIFKE
jgi:hypothetical protein